MKFIITDEQIEKLRPILPNIDELLNGSYDDFLGAIDDAMIAEMDDGKESSETSELLESVYDELCMQNLLKTAK